MCYFSSYNSRTRGIAVYVDKKASITVNKLRADAGGNYILLRVKQDKNTFILCVLYGPSEDNPGFFSNLFSILDDLNEQ